MTAPWEKYAAQAPQGGEGPWKKYAQTTEPSSDSATPIVPPGAGQDVKEQQSPSMMDRLMRQLGLTARAGLTGVSGTVGVVGDALNAGINKVAGTNLAPVSDSIQNLMDQANIPKPESTLEKLVGGVAQIGFGVADPAMSGITNAIKGAAPLYNAPNATNVHADLIKQAQDAGYKTPPSVAEAGLPGRAVEALAGKGQVHAIAREQNQKVSDALARKAIGLPDDAPLTPEMLEQVIKDTYQNGYGPVEHIPRIFGGSDFSDQLNSIVKRAQGGANSFPGAARDDIGTMVNKYRTDSFSGKDAVEAIKALRQQAGGAYQTGDRQMGEAQNQLAKALESQIDMHASSNSDAVGHSLIEGFRGAREQLAKQYAVRDRLNGAGHVDAGKFGEALKQGVPLTDELAQIANFANVAKPVAGVPQGSAPIANEMEIAGLFGGLFNPAIAAVPAARVAARKALMSRAGQGLFAQPAGAQQTPKLPWMNTLPAGFQMGSGLFEQ